MRVRFFPSGVFFSAVTAGGVLCTEERRERPRGRREPLLRIDTLPEVVPPRAEDR